ncbi:hypothetical protein [Planctomicrobium piriforme]|uniref:hypothetical protein n=1 Tax=Planctomicrobium piriforme TaxID=1576369 RepID=UPI000B80FD5F|nr:hypothetical protein [Planctomicrobium piriforme]
MALVVIAHGRLQGNCLFADEHASTQVTDAVSLDSARVLEFSQAVQLLKNAIRLNNDKLGALLATFFQEQISTSVKQEEVRNVKLGDGKRLTASFRPYSARRLACVMWRDRVKCDFYENESSETISRSLSLDGGLWRELIPSQRLGVIREVAQMPSILPIDPRELAGHDIRMPIVAMIDEYLPLSNKLQLQNQQLTVKLMTPAKQVVTMQFDGSQGFLPVLSELRHADGSVVQTSTISYQRIESRDAWFLDEIITRGFNPLLFREGMKREDAFVEWRTTTQRVTLLNAGDDLMQMLSLSFPADYTVQDQTHSETKTVGLRHAKAASSIATQSQPRRSAYAFYLVAFNMIAALLVCSFLWFRRYRLRSQ